MSHSSVVATLACVWLSALSPSAHAVEPTPTQAAPVNDAPVNSVPARPPLAGQLSSKFGIDPANPEASVPTLQQANQNPLEFGYFLQDLIEQADTAQKKNDWRRVALFYRAVAKAVPDRAKGWSKLCEAYQRAGDPERARRACRYAVERDGAELQDFLRYSDLILATPGATEKNTKAQGKSDDGSNPQARALTDEDRRELDGVLTHLKANGGTELVISHLRCEIGVKTKNVPELEACTTALKRLAPQDPKTIVFAWSLALLKGRVDEADRLIKAAKQAGVVVPNVERMEQLTSSLGGGPGVFRRGLWIAAAIALLGAVSWFVLRRRAVAA